MLIFEINTFCSLQRMFVLLIFWPTTLKCYKTIFYDNKFQTNNTLLILMVILEMAVINKHVNIINFKFLEIKYHQFKRFVQRWCRSMNFYHELLISFKKVWLQTADISMLKTIKIKLNTKTDIYFHLSKSK